MEKALETLQNGLLSVHMRRKCVSYESSKIWKFMPWCTVLQPKTILQHSEMVSGSVAVMIQIRHLKNLSSFFS